jgi:cobalt-zinc-cadmium efflux system protein
MSSARQPSPVVTERGQSSVAGNGGRTSGVIRPSGFTARERHQVRRLVVVMLITSAFFVAQLAGALWAESDVLKLEAVHVLTDVAALGLAAVAMRVAVRRPTARFTFGLRRVEPVAAIFNALLVLGATSLLVWEAIADLWREHAGPEPNRMLYVAAGGLVVNGVSAWLIHGAIGGGGEARDARQVEALEKVGVHEHVHQHEHEGKARDAREEPCEDFDHRHIAHHAHHGHGHVLNLRGAWLHLFGDALGSLAAAVAAVAIKVGASPKVDPLASFVVAAILVYGSVRLLHDAILVLLEAAPPHLAVERVRAAILGTGGVAELHDLHVWTLGAGHDAISAHVSAKSGDPSLAARIEATLRRHFQVEYVTIQVEVGGVTCQADTLEQ